MDANFTNPLLHRETEGESPLNEYQTSYGSSIWNSRAIKQGAKTHTETPSEAKTEANS